MTEGASFLRKEKTISRGGLPLHRGEGGSNGPNGAIVQFEKLRS